MLIRLLPSSTAPIIVSWSAISRLTRRAARSPSRSSWCMRPRLAPVIEVSAAENRAESASRTRSDRRQREQGGQSERSLRDQELAHRPRRRRPWRRRPSPMPRARMKVSWPASAFLSWAMWATRRSASKGAPGTSASARRQAGGGDGRGRRARRPGRRRGPGRRRSGRPAPGRRRPPRRAAGPRRSRSRPPGRGRRCGRGSAARGGPARVSSSATISAFISTERATAWARAAGSRASTSAPLASSHSKKAKSPSRPYLITSA